MWYTSQPPRSVLSRRTNCLQINRISLYPIDRFKSCSGSVTLYYLRGGQYDPRRKELRLFSIRMRGKGVINKKEENGSDNYGSVPRPHLSFFLYCIAFTLKKGFVSCPTGPSPPFSLRVCNVKTSNVPLFPSISLLSVPLCIYRSRGLLVLRLLIANHDPQTTRRRSIKSESLIY